MAVLTGSGVPIVNVGINGVPSAFVVDSGAFTSFVTSDTTRRLGLPVDHSRGAIIMSIGGAAFAPLVEIKKMSLGTAVARDVTLLEAGSFPRVTFGGRPLSGMFGGDFLANYDVEFDLPAHHVSLYTEKACNADFPQPWDDAAYREGFRLERRNAVMLDAWLDGRPARLQFDSGAALTTVRVDTAIAAGVTPAAVRADRTFAARGVDGRLLATRLHLFHSFELGPERISDPWIAIANMRTHGVLGADFLQTHRVWISYPHHLLWVQPIGHVHLAEPSLAARTASPAGLAPATADARGGEGPGGP